MEYKEINNDTINEPESNYYSDVYSLWETKEQLVIWQEVAKTSELSWIIDTDDTTITKIDNIFTLDVPNPDWKLFSLTIDWVSKVFKVWYFGSASAAYDNLEAQLIAWLTDYTVEYTGGTTFTIQNTLWTAISKNEPDLVRDITLSGWSPKSFITITIDWISVDIDWSIYASSNNALDYFRSQISPTTYLSFTASWWVLWIARADWAIPVITSTEQTNYTYVLECDYTALWTPPYFDYATTTVDWTTITYDPWFDPNVFATLNYNFNRTPLWLYTINNNYFHWTWIFNEILNLLIPDADYTVWTVIAWWEPTVFDFTVPIEKTDLTQIVWGDVIIYTTFPTNLGTSNFTMRAIETSYTASITVSTHTEIIITFALSSNNFLIPCKTKIHKIILKAISSNWSSEGTYELKTQRCASQYSTTTEEVSGKIFKTDGSNYWHIVKIQLWAFVMNWTTNTSNKINFTCT